MSKKKVKAPKWTYLSPDATCVARCKTEAGVKRITVNGRPITAKRARKLSLWFEKAARWSDADN